jgi:hypothetical protein
MLDDFEVIAHACFTFPDGPAPIRRRARPMARTRTPDWTPAPDLIWAIDKRADASCPEDDEAGGFRQVHRISASSEKRSRSDPSGPSPARHRFPPETPSGFTPGFRKTIAM